MKKIRFVSIYLLILAIIFFTLGALLEVHFFYFDESLFTINDESIQFPKYLHLILFLLGFLIITTVYLIEKREATILSLANLAKQKEIDERKRIEKEREVLIKELQEALDKVKTLSGFLPICANCKKIRDDEGYWQRVEKYIEDRSDAMFSHSICSECVKTLYPGLDTSDD